MLSICGEGGCRYALNKRLGQIWDVSQSLLSLISDELE